MEAERLEITQVQAEMVKYESKSNGAMRITFDTQENIAPDLRNKLQAGHEKVGWLSFLVDERKIDVMDVIGLPEIVLDTDEESPSTKYRKVLWVYWNQKKPTETFEQFYRQHYEKIITSVKEKLT